MYHEYLATEMKINMKQPTNLLAQCNFAVAECNAISTVAPVPVPACAPTKMLKKLQLYGDKACNQKEEVENTMTTYNEIEASRKYLNGRIQNIYWNKRDELATQFRIHNQDTPRNYKELIDAIKNDKFTLDTKRTAKIDACVEDDDWYGNAFDGITFNLPTAPDRDGYTAATKELDKKVQDTKDIINVGTPADGLKALQELEAWTPAGKAS